MKGRMMNAALAAALVLVAAPAMAGDAHEGFFVSLDAALATPGNVNTTIVNSAPSDSTSSGGGPVLTNDLYGTEFDDDIAAALTVGYSWGEKGRLSVSYWSYSDTASSVGSVPSNPNYNWFGIGPVASWGYSFYYDVDWNFEQELEASSIDVAYEIDAHPSDRLTMSYGIGLRIADFTDTTRGTYVLDPTGLAPSQMPASREIDSDGFGLTGSMGADVMLNDRFSLNTKLRVGFITTDVDSTHSITDVDGYYSAAGALWTQSVEQNDEVSLMVEFDAGAGIKLTDKLDLNVGWGYRRWSDIAEPLLSRASYGTDDQAVPQILGEDRNSISWSGPRIGVRVRF